MSKYTSHNKESSLQFGLAQPDRHDANCASEPKFYSYAADPEVKELLFQDDSSAYKLGPRCVDLHIDGGECDAIKVFYNHDQHQLNWWR